MSETALTKITWHATAATRFRFDMKVPPNPP
jgi:hypothetical protein